MAVSLHVPPLRLLLLGWHLRRFRLDGRVVLCHCGVFGGRRNLPQSGCPVVLGVQFGRVCWMRFQSHLLLLLWLEVRLVLGLLWGCLAGCTLDRIGNGLNIGQRSSPRALDVIAVVGLRRWRLFRWRCLVLWSGSFSGVLGLQHRGIRRMRPGSLWWHLRAKTCARQICFGKQLFKGNAGHQWLLASLARWHRIRWRRRSFW